ncbi:hypothetical protein TSUD_242450 [Trifolium subterraneum]|uniref:Uncharacterized protein n=1 Tax=Trifolium subterraneum TaxID=3900 RepID=A0A2Z6P510_TRISU|nr:hypothetical protein TSUD_242450 [Trifolium subterraneum]
MLPEQAVVVAALAVVTLFRLLHQHHESIDSLATLCKVDLKFGARSVEIGGWRWRKCSTVEKYLAILALVQYEPLKVCGI